jgi:hypothetical protein
MMWRSMILQCCRSVLRVAACVSGDAPVTVEDLDGRGAQSRVQDLVHELVGLGAIVMIVLDVMIAMDGRAQPFAAFESL